MTSHTRTFRIFVSSTFSDLKEERNALQRYVFPRLRELCTRHGCRFQAVDLRWGVRDEAGLDQQTMRVCLDEISKQLVAETRTPAPAAPGQPARVDYEYERRGTANLFLRDCRKTPH